MLPIPNKLQGDQHECNHRGARQRRAGPPGAARRPQRPVHRPHRQPGARPCAGQPGDPAARAGGRLPAFLPAQSQALSLLAMSEPGDPSLPELGQDIDIRSDIPRYRVWKHGELVAEPTDVHDWWRDDLVSFLIGCSFSFEEAMLDNGLPCVTSSRAATCPCTGPTCRRSAPACSAVPWSCPCAPEGGGRDTRHPGHFAFSLGAWRAGASG